MEKASIKQKNESDHESFNISSNISNSKTLTFIVCFAFFISCLHSFSYWTVFNVDIFLYLSIQDILIRSIVPMMISSGVLFGCFIGHMDSKKPKEIHYEGRPDLENERKRDDALKLLFYIFISVIVPILVGITFLHFKLYYGIAVIAAGIGPALLMAFAGKGWLQYISEKTKLPVTVLAAVTIISCLAVGTGLSKAQSIKSGKKGVDVQISSKQIGEMNGIFLGEAGGIIFLWDRKNEVLTQIKREDIGTLSASFSEEAERNRTPSPSSTD